MNLDPTEDTDNNYDFVRNRSNSEETSSHVSVEAPTPFFNAEDSNNFNFNRKKPEEIQPIIPKQKAFQHFP